MILKLCIIYFFLNISSQLYSEEFRDIRDMNEYQILSFNMLNLEDYNGEYHIAGIINGGIDFQHYEFQNISEIKIKMRYKEDNGYLHISSNFQNSEQHEINNRSRNDAIVGLIGADGPSGTSNVVIFFTNRGLVLYCWFRDICLDVNELGNFLLEK